MGSGSARRRRLARAGSTRGASLTEYVFLLALVTLGFSAALVAFGPRFVQQYHATRNRIASPYP
jgi:hypothetical protein